MLLDKISVLQEEKMTMEERLQMLEHSSAAMADDLLKKAALIQYYCMEGRSKGEDSKQTFLAVLT